MKRCGRLAPALVGGAGVVLLAVGLTCASAAEATANSPAEAGWQHAIANLALPGAGCFNATYPALEWHATQCAVAPELPLAPAVGNLSVPPTSSPAKPVGDGHDYSAVVSGPITKATGSFANVSPHIKEQGQYDGSGPQLKNTFTLQLNTQFFATPTCSGSSNPSNCLGWEQFVYDTHSNIVFMQYWLIDYAASCPSSWFTYGSDCYTNSPATRFSGAALTAADLATSVLSGSAAKGGNDAVELTNGSHASSVDNADTVLDLSHSWNTTEFDVFGDGGGAQAVFGTATTFEAQTSLLSSSQAAPECVKEGFTGETNNLKLTGTPALGTESTPTMGSEQTNGTKTHVSCATAPG
jgi:hypothetical protein